ncbi:MAG: S49 family peptidase [Phycisphaerales bacterium]
MFKWTSRARALVAVAALAAAPAAALSQSIGRLDLEGPILDRPGPLDWLAGGRPTLRSVMSTLAEAGADAEISAVVVRLKDAELNRTQIEELGSALEALAKAGKRTYVFAENYGPAELLLGSHAQQVVIQSGGGVSLPGLHMEEMYLADTLSWAGVKAELVQIGDYKGASEMFVNSAPSKAWDQNINQLLDSLYGAMRAELKRGRKLSDEKLDEAMRRVWIADAEEAIEAGLIDAAVDLPALGAFIAGRPDPEWVELDAAGEPTFSMDTTNPFAALPAMMKALTEPPSRSPDGPAIALVHIDGAIVDGDSGAGGLFGESSVGSRTVRNALEEVRAEDKIKGVIIRIESPGGSATASEVIWQGVRRVAEKKPVWVSVGSMAASGGYYIAVAGDRIYVNPSSIVGSIGVVGGKFAMGGLYDKLKVRVVERSRGPMGGMFTSVTPWSPEQIEQVRSKMRRTYDLFTKRVAAGRKGIDLSKTAEGRLFAGQKAVDLNMADTLGGLDECIGALASHLGLAEYEVLDYPGPQSLGEILEEMFGQFASAPGVRAGRPPALAGEAAAVLRTVVGERAWPGVRDSLGALMQLRREPVLLVSPQAIILK